MFRTILLNKEKSVKERLKNILLYFLRKKGAKKSWRIRHNKVFEKNVGYEEELNKGIEERHKKLWGDFDAKIDPATLRICSHISGISDPRIVPENLFVSEIEPSLITDRSIDFLSNKSFYNRWFSDGIFPKDILHCINGQYLNSQLDPITFETLNIISQDIQYPVVFKPNRGAYGGQGIYFVKGREELISLTQESKDFIIQEKIQQHEFFKQYNPVGLNTFRVYLYRSVKDHQIHVLTTALRMGKGGSLDNETAGGIHTMIRNNGCMNGYAVDKFGTKYLKHPDTGKEFNKFIPNYDGLKKLSLEIGRKVFLTSIIGLDLCYDSNGKWRVIEINTKGHTIRFAQYGGQPFFGIFTNEVIEFCKKSHWTNQ